MKNRLTGVALLLGLWVCQSAYAKPPPPDQYYPTLNKQPATMKLSDNGAYLLKMVPSRYAKQVNGDWKEIRKPIATAFKLTPEGAFEKLWTVDDAYPYGVYLLAGDGVYLVKINAVVSSMEDKNAMVIYNRGKVFRRYAPNVFMPQLKHLPWRAPWVSRPASGGRDIVLDGMSISFRTIDGKKWAFDIREAPAQSSAR